MDPKWIVVGILILIMVIAGVNLLICYVAKKVLEAVDEYEQRKYQEDCPTICWNEETDELSLAKREKEDQG